MIAFIHYPRRECSQQVSATLQQKDKSLRQKPNFPPEQRAGMPKFFHKEYGFMGWRDTLEVKSIGFFFQKKGVQVPVPTWQFTTFCKSNPSISDNTNSIGNQCVQKFRYYS